MYVLGFAIMDLIERLLRSIFFFLDSVIYSWIPTLYNTLITISRTSPLSQADIADMASRVYKLLAVFMIFKVTFSLIMYIVNPDDFSDKTKGVSKLITNIVISLALLILTPFIFRYAFELQTKILKNNTLMTVIFGKDLNRENNTIDTVGEQIAFVSIGPFITPDTSLFPKCSVLYTNEYDNETKKTVTKLNKECFGFEDVDEYVSDDSICEGTNTLCKAVDNAKGSYGITKDMLENYAGGIQHSNYHLLFRKEVVLSTTESNKKNEFVLKYWCGFSTAVAVIILLYFITACMDIGLRSIKLAFLQLVAPIPILSYIDPKSGKDGMFKKWYQMSLKTYLSLFIRLLALYFAIYVIGRVNNLTDIIDASYVSTMVIKVFIVIGALMFAKNFTKILEELGVKLDGGFQLNPIKKFNEQALGGKRITGAAGALAAGTVDRAARLATSPWPQKLAALNPFTAGGQLIRGFAGNGGFSGGMKAQANVNRRLRDSRVKGLSSTAAYLDYFGSKFGLDDATLERRGSRIRGNKDRIDQAEREVEEANRERNLRISELKQATAPAKEVQTRRKNAQASANKLMDQAEKIAANKADIRGTQAEEEKRKLQIAAMTKLRNGQTLTADDNKELGELGLSSATTQKDLLIKERELNKKKYTTNRRADAAAVEFLTQNQGTILEHAVLVGEGDSQVVFEAGTRIDANIVAAAVGAQGKYIKDSKKAVYNHLADKDDDSYNSLSEQAAFDSDYIEFENNVKLANDTITEYNANHNTSYAGFAMNVTDGDYYDVADTANNEVTASDTTRGLNAEVNVAEQEIAYLTEQNEKTRSEKKVDYVDEDGVRHFGDKAYTLEKAKSMHKPEDEQLQRDLKKNSNYRSIIGSHQ